MSQTALGELDIQGPMPGPLHYLRMRATAAVMRAAIAAGSWQTALEADQALVPYYRMVYPQVQSQDDCRFSACNIIYRGRTMRLRMT